MERAGVEQLAATRAVARPPIQVRHPWAVVHQHDELVATEPADAVASTHGQRQALGDHLEQLVTDLVSEVVVDVLEPIEVDEECRNLNVCSSSSAQHLLGPVDDQGTIGQSGQCVVHGLEPDLLHQPGIGDRGGCLRSESF